MIIEKSFSDEFPMRNFDGKLIAGVDEAGRGALAGLVIASAVVSSANSSLEECDDSKQLSHIRRLELVGIIKAKVREWAIGQASAEEIDRLNILRASLLAMRRALEQLATVPDVVLVDGNHAPNVSLQTITVIAGDARVKVISAASILAKVTRDQIMMNLHKRYPLYRFDKHKGYPTKQHLQILCDHGICAAHRKSYRPVRRRQLFG